MSGSYFERTYRRQGSRYLRRALFVQMQLLYGVIVAVIAGLSAYVHMSFGQFLRLALLACAFQLLYSLLFLPVQRRLTRPVNEWLARGPPHVAALAAGRGAEAAPCGV